MVENSLALITRRPIFKSSFPYSFRTKYLDRDIKELSDPSSDLSDVEKDLRRIDLNHKKYTFLLEVAQVNQKLLDFALKEKS